MRERLTPAALQRIVDAVPDEWMNGESAFANIQEQRAAYLAYLINRLEASRLFVEEAQRAHALLV